MARLPGRNPGEKHRVTRGPSLERLEPRELLATITVNTIADADVRDAELSLREAILITNGQLAPTALTPGEAAWVAGTPGGVDRDGIAFAIPGPGLHTISPISPLPVISRAVAIDGFSQPGATHNTQALTDDANLKIALDGAFAGAGTDGLAIRTNGTLIRGLAIGRFAGAGISVRGTSSANLIAGNFLGTHPLGGAGWGNGAAGIAVEGPANTIGGTAPADRNVISGNTGLLAVPGASQDASFAMTDPVASTVVRTDNDHGHLKLLVTASGSEPRVEARPFPNGAPAQALGSATGVIPRGMAPLANDGLIVVGDRPRGAVNYLAGRGDGTFAAPVTVATPAHPTGVASGYDFVKGSGNFVAVINAPGPGLAGELSFFRVDGVGAFSTPTTLPTGIDPAAVAYGYLGKDPSGSRFVYGFVVANAGDDTVSIYPIAADGAIGAPRTLAVGESPTAVALAYFGSQPATILVANSAGGTISVLTSPTDDPATLAVSDTLPVGPNPTSVALLTFSSATASYLAANSGDGTLTIYDRSAAGVPPAVRTLPLGPATGPLTLATFDGLLDFTRTLAILEAGADRVALVSNGSPLTSSEVLLSGAGAAGNVVAGNFIGPDASGVAAPGSPEVGVRISLAPRNLIGGSAPGAGNVISGHATAGVQVARIASVAGGGTRIEGNRIGTTPSGLAALSNGVGVLVNDDDVIVAGNVISGNLRDGVLAQGYFAALPPNVLFTYYVPRSVIVSNRIGVGADGTTPLGNGGDGIGLTYTDGATIGGAAIADRNLIANNGGQAILIDTTAKDTVVDGVPAASSVAEDLSITVSGPTGEVRVGSGLVYTITVRNTGPATPASLYIYAFTSPGASFFATDLAAAGGRDIVAYPAGFNGALPGIAPGTSRTFTVTVIPAAPGTFRFTTGVSDPIRPDADTNPANNEATVTTNVPIVDPLPPADVPPPAIDGGVARAAIKTKATALAVRFTAALDPGRATNRAAYKIAIAGKDKRFGTKDDKAFKIASARYDAASNTVTILTRKKLAANGRYRLTLGTAAAPLTGRNGAAIAGVTPSLDFGRAQLR